MKHILYFVLSAFIVTSAQAQVTSISSINVGGSVLSGLSLIAEQNNYGAPEMTFQPTSAYTAGVTFNINWYENLGLQIEGNYGFQGQTYFGTQNTIDVYKYVSLNYVQIPIFFKYTFTNYSRSQIAPDLYFVAGPQFGFLQSAKSEYVVNGSTMSFEEYHNDFAYNPLNQRHPEYTSDLELFNGFDLALASGFGAAFELSDYLILTAESRLTWGISDLNARDWRFPDLRNNYAASRNYLWGLKVGLLATVW